MTISRRFRHIAIACAAAALLAPHGAAAQSSGGLLMTAVVTEPAASVGLRTVAPASAGASVALRGPSGRTPDASLQIRVSGGCALIASVNPAWRAAAGQTGIRIRRQDGRTHALRDGQDVVVGACGDGRLDTQLGVELDGPGPADAAGLQPVLVRVEVNAGL
jgi:hypothetical protein